MYMATIFLPLISFLLVGLFGRFVGDRSSNLVSCSLLIASAVFSVIIFRDVVIEGRGVVVPLFTWFDVGMLKVTWALRFDTLSTIMVTVVNIISCLVHIYSVGYMHRDPSVPRFMAYLGLFTFMMLMLVTGESLVQVFFGWEGVGLASYLLIGFWYHKESANQASIKAFLVNRVGDFGFVIGLALIFFTFGSLNITEILQDAGSVASSVIPIFGWDVPVLELIGILLFIGAMGKSAQLGLHTWLPDAMEGPTPVSALIHAATMVTAGVFLVARMSPLYEFTPFARDVIIFVGASTALFAGTIALTQNDIKRVIAYSTCSQLGYMFFALGVSAYGAGIFHLVTHAFFKALLFLGAGAVIHGMSNEQDMRHMGGLATYMPFTCTVMWIGSLALAGVPFFAGFYSKDAILEAAWFSQSLMGPYAYWLGIAAAVLTAFYSWRVLFMTFHGPSRGEEVVMGHVHEPGPTMFIPLSLLSIGAIFSGYIGAKSFLSEGAAFWRGSLITVKQTTEHLPLLIHALPMIAGAVGIGAAFLFYNRFPKWPESLSQSLASLYKLFLNKWYFDELYEKVFVKPAHFLGRLLWTRGDVKTIDRYGPDGLATTTIKLANRVSRIQTGYIYHYAFGIILGVSILAAWYLLLGIGG